MSTPATIQDALTALSNGGVVQIIDSGRYVETLAIDATAAQRLELRAANKHRPTLVLNGDWLITGDTDAEVTLNGLLIAGGTLRVPASPGNRLRKLRLQHCTLVPGLSLTNTGEPEHPDQPGLIVELANMTVDITHCIVGGLRVVDSVHVQITDSMVDAISETGVAYASLDGKAAGGTLQIVDSTVVGKVHTVLLELASNTIFLARLAVGDGWTAPIRTERRQAGCVRFSFLPLSALVPRPTRR